MNTDQKLAVNKFVVDEAHPHIVIHQDRLTESTIRALVMYCPAGLYTLSDDGHLHVEYAGCLECGTCRVLCSEHENAMIWNHPLPSFGVQYHMG